MIKIEHTIYASTEQMEFVIESMRNPTNSWNKSDSTINSCLCSGSNCQCCDVCCDGDFEIGDSDLEFMQRSEVAGTERRKFMQMMPVYMRITAPLYWWDKFDAYASDIVKISCSTVNKIQEHILSLEDFSYEHLSPYSIELLESQVNEINKAILYFREHEDKEDLWQMIQLLPSSYNQTANVMINYEVLANIYRTHKSDELDEWRSFCKFIEQVPYSELITVVYKDDEFFLHANSVNALQNNEDRVSDILYHMQSEILMLHNSINGGKK